MSIFLLKKALIISNFEKKRLKTQENRLLFTYTEIVENTA